MQLCTYIQYSNIYMRYLEWFINFLKFGFSLGFNFIWWVPIRIPFRNKRLVYPIHLFSDCSWRILRMNRRSMILLKKKYIYISSIHLIRKSCSANTHRLVTRQGCKSPWENVLEEEEEEDEDEDEDDDEEEERFEEKWN